MIFVLLSFQIGKKYKAPPSQAVISNSDSFPFEKPNYHKLIQYVNYTGKVNHVPHLINFKGLSMNQPFPVGKLKYKLN